MTATKKVYRVHRVDQSIRRPTCEAGEVREIDLVNNSLDVFKIEFASTHAAQGMITLCQIFIAQEESRERSQRAQRGAETRRLNKERAKV